MGHWIELKPEGAGPIRAWRAEPEGRPRAGIVVIQEIFGVNAHIRAVTDRFAVDDYLAIAPAVFDHVEPGFDVGYDAESRARGIAVVGKVDREQAMRDVAAAIGVAKEGGKVGIVGYCFGGSIAWAAAGTLPDLSAAVGYYGGQILAMKDMRPRVPTILHFGKHDHGIPLEVADRVKALHPEVDVYIYDAGHGFNSDRRTDYNEACAKLGRQRTLELFHANGG